MGYGKFNEWDGDAAKILDDFLPDRIYDAHCHLYDKKIIAGYEPLIEAWAQAPDQDVDTYRKDMSPLFGNRQVSLHFFLDPVANGGRFSREKEAAFVAGEVAKHPDCTGEVTVFPKDDADTLEKLAKTPGVRGFKCYHTLIEQDPEHPVNTFQSDIGEYLPESAWEVCQKHHLCMTLHMVKDKALADPENLNYIRTMSKRYPDAVLILAHAARAFASWTGVETVEKLKDCDNVWFDFAAVTESPAIQQIIKKTGTERCMWGSDYPVALFRGKCISIADTFYWIYQRDLDNFSGLTTLRSWMVGTENLMAVRQACILAELGQEAIERIFYKNAQRLLHGK